MSSDEIDTLLYVLVCAVAPSPEQIGLALARRPPRNRADSYESGRRFAKPLVLHGALSKRRFDGYRITEKGRIAAGLLIGKDSGLRAAYFDEA